MAISEHCYVHTYFAKTVSRPMKSYHRQLIVSVTFIHYQNATLAAGNASAGGENHLPERRWIS